MGRHLKQVLTSTGLDRREIGYYSTPPFVAEFIAKKCLEISPKSTSVFDPCIGKGELALPFLQRGAVVDGIDIFAHELPPNVNFTQKDFLQFYRERVSQRILNFRESLPHDILVANPPYNCHEVEYIRQNKKWLSQLFSVPGVLNLYAMFLWALIDLAKEGAVIAVITHDSFLTANGHKLLRNKMATECCVRYLLLAPTDLFLSQGADVRTCIMILTKEKRENGVAKIANRPTSTMEFRKCLKVEEFEEMETSRLRLSSETDFGEFIIGVPHDILRLFEAPRLGKTFHCVTGISTGNDKKFLRKQSEPGFSVPFYKNPGSRKFFTSPDAFIIDDYLDEPRRTKNFMVRNKPLICRGGITCSSMGVTFSAAYLPANSTFGVNPNIIVADPDRWWLMAYLNSSLVTYIVRGVLVRSNMITSGYASRIPVPQFKESIKKKLSRIARMAYEERVSPKDSNFIIDKIDEILTSDLRISHRTWEQIEKFSSDLLRLT